MKRLTARQSQILAGVWVRATLPHPLARIFPTPQWSNHPTQNHESSHHKNLRSARCGVSETSRPGINSSSHVIALLGSRDKEAARLVFARSADATGDMNTLMREACDARRTRRRQTGSGARWRKECLETRGSFCAGVEEFQEEQLKTFSIYHFPFLDFPFEPGDRQSREGAKERQVRQDVKAELLYPLS